MAKYVAAVASQVRNAVADDGKYPHQSLHLHIMEVEPDRIVSWFPGDPRHLAQSAVDQIEVGLPAVSLVVLPAALDLVAVVADGRGEALVERLALAPQLPLAVADAHLVDAANVPVVAVELVVAAVGRVAAVDTDAVGRLGRLHGGTLEQKLAALQPFEGALGLTRPRLAAGRRRRLAPLTDQHLEFLERLLRSRLIHGYPFPGLFPGLLIWTIHAIIA